MIRVGERVGVRATVHAMRRAFAVAFLTSHPGAIEALQALNHSRMVYLRALNRSKAMERYETSRGVSGYNRMRGGAYGIRTRLQTGMFSLSRYHRGLHQVSSGKQIGIVEFSFRDERVRVSPRRRDEVIVSDGFTDSGPRHAGEVEERDAPMAQVVR